MAGNYTTVPDKHDGDVFTTAMWTTYIEQNLNIGVARLLADPVVLAASAASIDFSSIPSTFGSLLIVYSLESDVAGASGIGLQMKLNAIATGYASKMYDGNSADNAVQLLNFSGGTAATVGLLPNMGALATLPPAVGMILIPNYAAGVAGQNSGSKSWRGSGYAAYYNGAGTITEATVDGGHTANTVGPVNEVTLLPASGNFVGSVGGNSFQSKVALYGLPT